MVHRGHHGARQLLLASEEQGEGGMELGQQGLLPSLCPQLLSRGQAAVVAVLVPPLQGPRSVRGRGFGGNGFVWSYG